MNFLILTTETVRRGTTGTTSTNVKEWKPTKPRTRNTHLHRNPLVSGNFSFASALCEVRGSGIFPSLQQFGVDFFRMTVESVVFDVWFSLDWIPILPCNRGLIWRFYMFYIHPQCIKMMFFFKYPGWPLQLLPKVGHCCHLHSKDYTPKNERDRLDPKKIRMAVLESRRRLTLAHLIGDRLIPEQLQLIVGFYM